MTATQTLSREGLELAGQVALVTGAAGGWDRDLPDAAERRRFSGSCGCSR